MLPVSTFSIAEDENERLWLGTGSGVYVFEKSNNTFTRYVHSENNRNSLIADHINGIMRECSKKCVILNFVWQSSVAVGERALPYKINVL
jgi:hypothetical protein